MKAVTPPTAAAPKKSQYILYFHGVSRPNVARLRSAEVCNTKSMSHFNRTNPKLTQWLRATAEYSEERKIPFG